MAERGDNSRCGASARRNQPTCPSDRSLFDHESTYSPRSRSKTYAVSMATAQRRHVSTRIPVSGPSRRYFRLERPGSRSRWSTYYRPGIPPRARNRGPRQGARIAQVAVLRVLWGRATAESLPGSSTALSLPSRVAAKPANRPIMSRSSFRIALDGRRTTARFGRLFKPQEWAPSTCFSASPAAKRTVGVSASAGSFPRAATSMTVTASDAIGTERRT
jgi:hypothetical protein